MGSNEVENEGQGVARFDVQVPKQELDLEVAKERQPGSPTEDLAHHLRSALSVVPLALWTIDREGLLSVSEGAALKNLGLLPGQLVGSNVFDLYRETPEALVPIRACLEGQEVSAQVEIGNLAFENRYFPAFVDGVCVGMTGISLDVTDRVAGERRTARAEARFRSLVENSPDMIFNVGEAAEVTFVNRRMMNAAEVPQRGEHLFRYLVPVDRERAERALKSVWALGKRQEFSARTLGGSRLRYRLGPLKKGDMVTGVTAVATDVTREHEAEEEKAHLRAQLLHGQKLESLGLLAGGIAHDFNNLLVAVLGHADLAKSVLDGAHPARENLDGVVQASLRAAELCSQMLAYSGRGIRERQALNLSELVNELGQLLRVSLGEGVSLVTDLDCSARPIDADGAQVQQVVMNLLTNASDAMGSASGCITVRVHEIQVGADELAQSILSRPLSAGTYVCLEVADKGTGMDSDTLDRMFDPFFTTKTTGRGLGMAAVLGIIDSHHAALMVDSQMGVGTLVKVLFPVSQEGQQRARLPSAPPVPGAIGEGRCALVVDDEAMVLEVALSSLGRLGFTTLAARNGREAVDLFQENQGRISVILLDLTMPIMGGHEALRLIRAIDPLVPVVVSSGYQRPDLDADLSGDVRPLAKPYRLKDLERAIREALGDSPVSVRL